MLRASIKRRPWSTASTWLSKHHAHCKAALAQVTFTCLWGSETTLRGKNKIHWFHSPYSYLVWLLLWKLEPRVPQREKDSDCEFHWKVILPLLLWMKADLIYSFPLALKSNLDIILYQKKTLLSFSIIFLRLFRPGICR